MPVFSAVAIGKDKKAVSKPTHQLVSDAEYSPRTIYVNRDGALPSAWQGSESWVSFTLPRECGVLDSMRLALDITNSEDESVHMPTSLWVSRIEISIGADIAETVYADDQYHETVGMVPKQYFDEISGSMNVSRDFDLVSGGLPAGAQRLFVPLPGSFLTSMRPFVAGFDSQFKIKVYFASSTTADADVSHANPAPSLTLNEAQLFITEAQMSKEEWARTEKMHRTGIVDYSAVFRERMSEPTTFTANSSTPLYLRSFKNDSAGLLVYVQANTGANSTSIKLAPLQDLTLQDAVGNKLTEIIRSDYLKSYVYTDQVDSPFTTHPSTSQPKGANLFLIPFSSSFGDTVRTGNNYGKHTMTGQERLIMTPTATTPGSSVVNITSYSYGHVVVRNGKHYIQLVSTQHEGSCGKMY